MTRQLIPIAKAHEHEVPCTATSLHWVAFHREYNGARAFGAIVKFGGRLYIDPPRFLEWMATGPRISPPAVRSKTKPTKKAPKGATARA